MDYTAFQNYPIQILGISEKQNDLIQSIAETVISEIEYTGNESDLTPILPYFVFFKFCQYRESDTTVNSGEMKTLSEKTVSSRMNQINAWNKGAKMLNDLCTSNETTANAYYLSKIRLV